MRNKVFAFLFLGILFTTASAQVSWTKQNSGELDGLASVIVTGDGIVAVARYTFTLLTSPDAVNWTPRQTGNTGGAGAGFDGIAYGNNQLLALSWADQRILTSVDNGATWVSRLSGDTDSFGHFPIAAAWTGSRWVLVGVGGDVMTSSDGIAWTRQTSGVSTNLRSIVWTGTQLVAVGTDGGILTSPDGVSWIFRNSGTNQGLYDVVWGGGRLVAVGVGGTILTSPDGIAWTVRNSGTAKDVNGITWTGHQYVAVGGDPNARENNVVLSSPDAVTWSVRSTGSTNILQDVVWTGNQLVAVGQFGTILTSSEDLTGIRIRQGREYKNGASLRLTPSELSVSFPNFSEGKTMAAVYGAEGRKFVEVRSNTAAKTLSVPVGPLPNGPYVLKVSGPMERATYPFLIQK